MTDTTDIVQSADRAGRGAADLDAADAAHPEGTDSVRPESTDAGPSNRAVEQPVDEALIEEVEEALKDVVDPELGINIVDLGLVYKLTVDADDVAIIDLTLTSAACPLTDLIEEQVAAALTGGEGLVSGYHINWVWLPPWGPERITEDGREQMRALGFNI